jgi:hypothetical protein
MGAFDRWSDGPNGDTPTEVPAVGKFAAVVGLDALAGTQHQGRGLRRHEAPHERAYAGLARDISGFASNLLAGRAIGPTAVASDQAALNEASSAWRVGGTTGPFGILGFESGDGGGRHPRAGSRWKAVISP